MTNDYDDPELNETANSKRRGKFVRLPDKTIQCAYCGRETVHFHDGNQKYGNVRVSMWTCKVCESTHSERKH